MTGQYDCGFCGERHHFSSSISIKHQKLYEEEQQKRKSQGLDYWERGFYNEAVTKTLKEVG